MVLTRRKGHFYFLSPTRVFSCDETTVALPISNYKCFSTVVYFADRRSSGSWGFECWSRTHIFQANVDFCRQKKKHINKHWSVALLDAILRIQEHGKNVEDTDEAYWMKFKWVEVFDLYGAVNFSETVNVFIALSTSTNNVLFFQIWKLWFR